MAERFQTRLRYGLPWRYRLETDNFDKQGKPLAPSKQIPSISENKNGNGRTTHEEIQQTQIIYQSPQSSPVVATD